MSLSEASAVRGRDAQEEPLDLLDWLARLMLAPRSQAFVLAFPVLCLAGSLALRFAVDAYLPAGFPFLTFFPAVLLVAVFAGIRAGIVVGVLAGLAAWYFFVPPFWSFGLSGNTAVAMAFYGLIVTTELVLIAATKQALARLKSVNERNAQLALSRELMFNELQHRVSNNLATVAALLRMQAARTDHEGARQTLSAAQVRIATISRLQRRLHSPDVQSVDAASFLRDIAEDCLEAAGTQGVSIDYDLTPADVPQEQAIPLGLIVSELLMNAVEHGSADGRTPQLSLSILREPVGDTPGVSRLTVRVQDNGPGVGPGFRVEDSTSLGLGIARQFASMIGGALEIRDAPGGGAISELVFETTPG